jgi:hypothetical protein
LRRLALIAALIVLAASQARAAEPIPGSSCAGQNANSFTWSGASQNGGETYGLFCNGGTSLYTGVINFLSTGNVGIGTTTPTTPLHVLGNATVNGTLYFQTNDTGTYINGYGLGSDEMIIHTGNMGGANLAIYDWAGDPRISGSIHIGSDAAVPLYFFTSNTERARIDASGNLGIGTTSPGALLDIGNATTTLGTMRLEGNTSGYVQIQPAAAAGSWTATLPSSAGSSGQVLSTDGTGVTSWISKGYMGGLSLVGKASCNWTSTTSWAGMAANANCNALTADGSATSPGKYPAIEFASLPAGTYRVTFDIPFDSGSHGCALRISDGTSTAGITHVIGSAQDYVIGIFTYASTQTNITFSLQVKDATASDCTVYGDAATTGLLVTDFVSKFWVEKL